MIIGRVAAWIFTKFIEVGTTNASRSSRRKEALPPLQKNSEPANERICEWKIGWGKCSKTEAEIDGDRRDACPTVLQSIVCAIHWPHAASLRFEPPYVGCYEDLEPLAPAIAGLKIVPEFDVFLIFFPAQK